MAIDVQRESFVPKSRHLQTYLSPQNGSPDRYSPSNTESEDCALETLDAIWLEIEREELAEAWKDYYFVKNCVSMTERYAKRRAKEGYPSLVIALEEFKRQCPNPPPHQRICVSNPWG